MPITPTPISPSVTYFIDMSGSNPANLVSNEIHTVSEAHFADYYFIIPNFAPFYAQNFAMSISINGIVTTLIENIDYSLVLPYVTGTRTTGKPMYGGITIHNLALNGILSLTYQTIGGDQLVDRLYVLNYLVEKAYNPRTTIWDIITNVPNALPPNPHYQDYDQFLGQDSLILKLNEMKDAILANSTNTSAQILSIVNNLSNNTTNGLAFTGGTMTSPLILAGNPNTALEAATKQYVDSSDLALQTQVTTLQGAVTTFNASTVTLTYVDTKDALKVNKAGDTMTGQLVLPGAPTLTTHATDKGYVDTLVTTHTANVALHLTPAQNTLLDAVTVTSTEINTLSGTTSNIQTQINTLSTTLVPTGTVIEVDTTTTPSKYLRTNGTQVSKTTYAALFAVIGERYAPLMSGMKGQPWRQQYSFNKANSTIGTWVANTPLSNNVSNSHVIVTKNRVYLLGGWLNNTSTSTSTVYTAPINPNGTLGALVNSTPLPVAVGYSQAIVTNNRVYLLGGYVNGIEISTVYTTSINPDGTLGAWVTDTPLPINLADPQAIVTNNRVYLLGGFNGVAALSTIYTAPINPDGTLGAWVLDTSILPEIITTAQAIITSSRMYLLGGWNGTISLNTVYSTPFSGGLNNYLNPISINATTFALPDYTIMDTASSPKSYHYIKF